MEMKYRRMNETELIVLGKVNGYKIYQCPLSEEESLGRIIGCTKNGKIYYKGTTNKWVELKPYEMWKEKKRRRREWKVTIEVWKNGERFRKRYNVARLMGCTFFCYSTGDKLGIRDDFTVDHLVYIVKGKYVTSDTRHWRLDEIDVCTLEENRRRWKEAQRKFMAGLLK